MIKIYWSILLTALTCPGFSDTIHSNLLPETILSTSLDNFQSNSAHVKKAIQMALELAGRNIGYKYGSADPSLGGMDCSGTIYYLLTKLGIQSVPHSSDGIYQWVKKAGKFYPNHTDDLSSRELSHLKPGDLLFWSGTYQAPGNAYVTHVMMYIGKNTQGEPLMIGSSNGRTYKGRQIYGVSVFDFKIPFANSKSKFIGYSCIPSFTCKS